MGSLTANLSAEDLSSFIAVKAHLNCATLSHEYALKYNSLCKDLLPVVPLYDVSSVCVCLLYPSMT